MLGKKIISNVKNKKRQINWKKYITNKDLIFPVYIGSSEKPKDKTIRSHSLTENGQKTQRAFSENDMVWNYNVTRHPGKH